MSFRTIPAPLDRSFELVRRSLLQSNALPFAQRLSARQMQQAFDEAGVAFGESDDAVDTPAVVLWAMLSQMLFTDRQRSCVAAVMRVAAYCASFRRPICATNTGAYCHARGKIPAEVVQRLAREVAGGCEAEVPDEWRWHGRTVKLVDGTTCSMPDTKENQAEYPQSPSQAEGLGFPLLRAVALTSPATGMIVAAALGPDSGKETGEPALLRSLLDALSPGDVLLADRDDCGWFLLVLLQEPGVDFVVRLHHM